MCLLWVRSESPSSRRVRLEPESRFSLSNTSSFVRARDERPARRLRGEACSAHVEQNCISQVKAGYAGGRRQVEGVERTWRSLARERRRAPKRLVGRQPPLAQLLVEVRPVCDGGQHLAATPTRREGRLRRRRGTRGSGVGSESVGPCLPVGNAVLFT
jgi:hypothetical protein